MTLMTQPPRLSNPSHTEKTALSVALTSGRRDLREAKLKLAGHSIGAPTREAAELCERAKQGGQRALAMKRDAFLPLLGEKDMLSFYGSVFLE